MFYDLFKKVAFSLDAEMAHTLSMKTISHFPLLCSEIFSQNDISSKYVTKLHHMDWAFPVGLAAGLDKNAEAIDFFSRLYLGAVEVGTVTPLAQAGNPKPRLFRYPEEESLRNCMGFNNHGMQHMAFQLSQLAPRGKREKLVGVNLGKNKDTPGEQAYADYQKLYSQFADLADYLVINISSPNTPGLRDLQARAGVEQILISLKELRRKVDCPLYLKVAPDLNFDDLDSLLECAIDHNLQGLIATNTTIMPERGAGGVSGKLLLEKSKKMREHIFIQLKGVPVFDCIGVGGISSYQDLWDFWKTGGRAVQIYSAFIFQGPKILAEMKKGIDQTLQKYKLSSVTELLENIDEIERP